MCLAIKPQRKRKHEAIVYLLGEINSNRTQVTDIFAPNAFTNLGSFVVPPREMARLMRYAAEAGLTVVGQVHTHPRDAYHSPGDYKGMDIRHPGYVSMVLPVYGDELPELTAVDVIRFDANDGWIQIAVPEVEN